MKTTKIVYGITALVLFMGHTPAHADIQLIVNGGFETGDFTGWGQPSINPNPWSVVSFNPFAGSFAAYNPAESTAFAGTTLYQSINPTLVNNITSAGYWYYNQGGLGTVGTGAQLTFSDGTSVEDILFTDDPAYQENTWTFFNLEPFLLDYPGKSLVQIGFDPKVGGSQEIDDVSITANAVPEPSALGLLAVGITAFLVRRRTLSASPPSGHSGF
jgi:hypothetical protein